MLSLVGLKSPPPASLAEGLGLAAVSAAFAAPVAPAAACIGRPVAVCCVSNGASPDAVGCEKSGDEGL